jgi:3-isopropylmalate/(R)-2-methylmalate dehydratase large subunit
MGKDVFLHVCGTYGTDFAQYKSLEWVGSAIGAMSLDSRMCISNQAVEVGAKFSLFEADQKALDYVMPRARRTFEPVAADPDAVYIREIEVDGSSLTPLVAQPHGMDMVNPPPATAMSGSIRRISAAARAGASRISPLRPKYSKAAKSIKACGVFWERRTGRFMRRRFGGYIATLVDAGVLVCHPHCGPCTGVMGTLASGEVCITSTTRNFKGRMGSPDASIYLGSPATVAASAITGCITDPREVM